MPIKNFNQGVSISGGLLTVNNMVAGKRPVINIVSHDNNESASTLHELKNEIDSLQQAVYSLSQAIEADAVLSQAQRQVARSDLANFSEEIKKPLSEQNSETKKIFWGRISETVKFSSALVSLSTTVAKLTGVI